MSVCMRVCVSDLGYFHTQTNYLGPTSNLRLKGLRYFVVSVPVFSCSLTRNKLDFLFKVSYFAFHDPQARWCSSLLHDKYVVFQG